MTGTAFNVVLAAPTIDLKGWEDQASKWTSLNKGAGVNSNFSPLTVKALYATGIILACCRSVSILLNHENGFSTSFYPAYAIFASAIDILGRCIRGNAEPKEPTKDIRAGFQWLAMPSGDQYARIRDEYILARTSNYDYSIGALISLRHFAAHGQAVHKNAMLDFDYLILGEMPPLLAKGMQEYWNQLGANEDLCNHLAKANITPYRNTPLADAAWSGINGDESLLVPSIGKVFSQFNWTYKDQLLDRLRTSIADARE